MSNDKRDQGVRQGIEESRQDRRQDEVARQRPGPKDQQVHDEHVKRPRPGDGRRD